MIYVLEDDDSIRKLVQYALSQAGFETQGFETPRKFFEVLETIEAIEETRTTNRVGNAESATENAADVNLPQLVILDIMLPEEDGISVLQKLKAGDATKNIPVIMLTAKDTEFDKVTGLDSGADDYITKPFGIMEMTARVKAVIRRYEKTCGITTDRIAGSDSLATAARSSEITYKNITLNKDSHQVFVTENGERHEIILTVKEFDLLSLFLENTNVVLTRERLLDVVWKLESVVETRTVDVHVRYLRAKLGMAGDLIQTVRGVGYKIG